jgi:glycosyltransferase involved in cell wall biosynthesis
MEPMQTGTHPFLSIIVPTYHDWVRLQLCLDALAAQTYAAQYFEIIVANNDPEDKQPSTLVLPRNCTIIDVAKKGSYAARNAALSIAKGTIIGFTDSDCIPAGDWIENAVTYFASHPECSRIAGHITIFYQQKKPSSAELYDSLYSFRQKRYAEKGTCVTGNMFTYRHVFDKVGLFNDAQMSFGDLVWGNAANKAGFVIHYVRNVALRHPSRNMKELIKKEKRLGGGVGMLRRGKVSPAKLTLSFINGLRPRIGEIKFVFQNGKEMGFVQKCAVIFIRHYLLNLRTYEQIRVTMGKEPNRA